MILKRLNIPIESLANYLLLPLIISASLLFMQSSLLLSLVAIFIPVFLLSWIISKYNFQYYLLILIVVLLPLSFEYNAFEGVNINMPTEPLLAVALFSIAFDILKKPGLLYKLFEKESLWIIPLLLSYVICTFTSTMTIVSIKFSIVNITYILVFFLWQKFLFKNQPNLFPNLMILYSISMITVVIYGLFRFSNYNWNPATIKGIFRPFYSDHTIFGATSAILATFWLIYSMKSKLLSLRMIYILAGICFAFLVVFSNSRAALLSFCFFGFILIIFLLQIRLKYLIFVLILGIIVSIIFRRDLLNKLHSDNYMSHDYRYNYIEQMESSGNISSDVSNLERLNRWASGLKMFDEKPMLGFGPGTYQFKYIPYQKKEYMNRLTVKDPWHVPENSGGTAHSEYILRLSEMGILGFSAFLLIIFRLTWISFQNATGGNRRKYIYLSFAVMSTYLFHACFNNFLNTDKFAFLFWGLAAWIMALYEIKDKDEIISNNN